MSHAFRQAAAAILASSGLLRSMSPAAEGSAARVLLVGHHRVLPLPDEAMHCGDVELVSATPEQFAWQVEYLARHFEPVTCRQIADALDGRASLPRRAVAITFDDGFADLVEHALPILQRARVPATVFVASDYVNSREPFWFDLVAQVIRTAPAGTIRLPPVADGIPADDSARSRARSAYDVLKWLKSCPDQERLAFLGALHDQHADLVAAVSPALGRALSWEQLRELSASGIEIGAHSASHPCLARLDAVKLHRELVEPKREIEARLGIECPSVAYPFGGAQAFTDAVMEAVAGAGYRIGVTYVPGVNKLAHASRFALLRQHVERYTSRSYFKATVNLPTIFQ